MARFSRWSRSSNPYHPDIPLFLLLIPFIAGFNYWLTYSNIKFNWFLLLTFTIDTVQGYIAVWGVRELVLYLDKELPYRDQVFKRIWVQTISSLLLGVAIIAVLTELVCLIARGHFVPLHFYTHDLPIISIWFFVVNSIYIILFFYQKWRASENQQAQLQEGLMLRHKKTDLKLGFQEIVGFSIDGDYCQCFDQDGNRYLIERSLSRIQEQLPPSLFYRLNRQHTLHRDTISGFERGKNGKITVLVNSSCFPSKIPVSRTKAADFKRWFNHDIAHISAENF
ncbi:MAG: LytTR family transcriptional regulator DNA-binding domain-containing protein [Bacteroidota bacterium]